MIKIAENQSKDIYLTLSENQTLIATTVSTVYYLFEAESNDSGNKTYWYGEDTSTNTNRYNKFSFTNGGTYSYNGEFTLEPGTYDYTAWETLYNDLNVDNATSILETGLMRVTGTVSSSTYTGGDNDTGYIYYD